MAINIAELIRRLEDRGLSDSLIQDIIAASNETITAQENQFDETSAQSIRQHFETVNATLEENRSLLQETLDVNEELQNNYTQEKELLMDIIDEEIEAGNLSSERLKNAQRRIKELSKLNKAIEDYNDGMAKGEEAAKQILQATLGLSTEWSALSSKSGRKGMGKGFVTNLKSLMSPMNLLIALAQKIFERAVAYDKASADLFKRTGLDNTMINLKNIATNLKGMSTELQDKAAKSVGDFQEGYRSFGELQKEQVELTAETITVLNHFGVSNSDTVETFGILTKTLGKTPEQANRILNNTTAIAEELGRPPSEILSDFTKAMPILAIYGQESERMFRNISTQAALLGIPVSKIAQLNQGMDTFEGAAKAAQAFNVAAGAPFLSAQALLAADGDAKLDMIAEAYRRATPAQRAHIERPRILRGLASDANVSVDELVKLLKLDASKYKSKASDVQSAGATLAENITKVQENQTAMDKITAQIQRIIDNIIKFTNFDKGLGYAANMLTKFVEFIVGDKDDRARKTKSNRNTIMAQGGAVRNRMGDVVSRKQLDTEEKYRKAMSVDLEKIPRKSMGGGFDRANMRKRQAAMERNAGRLVQAGLSEQDALAFVNRGYFNRLGQDIGIKKEIKKQMETDRLLKMVGIDLAGRGTPLAIQKPIDLQGMDIDTNKAGLGYTLKEREVEFEDAVAAPLASPSGFVQPVFDKQDKFYAAKDGGAIANALDEVLHAVDKLIEEKQDVNLNISERKLAQAVDSAFVALNARRM